MVFALLLSIIIAQNVFIHANALGFCGASGQTIGNFTQITSGFCSRTQQGQVPNVDHMVSTIITSPSFGDRITSHTSITVTIKTLNMALGFFSDPEADYYSTTRQ